MVAGAAVLVERVAKRFGRLEVLRGVDLRLAPGRITAVVGPNAAGKSTLIKAMLAGDNLGLVACRQCREEPGAFVTRWMPGPLVGIGR